MRQGTLGKPRVNYSLGPYNKSNKTEQWIRLTEGCPHNCPFCYEPTKFKIFAVPAIIRNKVKIMDMNLLAKPEAIKIIECLGNKRVNGKVVHYELICGADYRFMTMELARAMKKARFKNMRIAWDGGIMEQLKIRDAIGKLKLAGYASDGIMLFMISNWRVPKTENMRKLDLCKIWNVKVGDCYYDNQTAPNINPIHWSDEDIKSFRRNVRKHNQLVRFKMDPQVSINCHRGAK